MKPSQTALFVIAIVFLSLTAWLTILSILSVWVFALYASSSLITFILYAIDKS